MFSLPGKDLIMNETLFSQDRIEGKRDIPICRELARFMPCRFTPAPLPLCEETTRRFRELGRLLMRFYTAQNKLYLESVNGKAPEWVAKYLDNGKPGEIVRLGRAKAFRGALPPIIRPDV